MSYIDLNKKDPFFLYLKGDDPFAHLAVEDLLLRQSQREGLVLWRSSPCVVLGRFQNPWKECYWQSFKRKKLRLVRRQSGGGTVYHDKGNLNFSFFQSKESLDKENNLSLIIEALGKLDINIDQNSRHDLITSNEQGTFKVSGSAFKQTKDRALHHGTLLLEAKLDGLGDSLRPKVWNIETKASVSVRSPVINLIEDRGDLEFADIINVIFDSWKGKKVITERLELLNTELYEKKTYQKFSSSEWIWSETPKFCLKLDRLSLYFEKGRVVELRGDLALELIFLKELGPGEKLDRKELRALIDRSTAHKKITSDEISQLTDFFCSEE